MTYLVARTCTEVLKQTGEKVSKSIEDFRGLGAYVLLGDPGAGKTESFKAEARACNGFYVSARDFVALSFPATARGKTIFIDGLDESRAGEGDGRTPLDRIRKRFDQLDRPSFRLSCREADWLGASDRDALAAVAPADELSVVHLDPLTQEQIRDILAHHPAVLDPTGFLKNAEERGLDALLQNPQTLNLLIEAVKGNEWPSTRQETFRLACEKLVSEPNSEHRAANRDHSVDTVALLNAAGGLCAIQLLADISGFTETAQTRKDILALREIGWMGELTVSRALKTRLFIGIGEEEFAPAHRSVAEYLAARFLTQKIENEHLPIGRVLALITATDGGVVAGLRGLNAWLAVHSHESRQRLIQIDPLGVVLYGDIKIFSVNDKLTLLKALHDLACQYEGFRWQDWSAKPFGALATPDMVEHFKVILSSPSRDAGYQSFLDCVLDAVRFGDPLPQLKNELRVAALDATRWPGVRNDALKSYVRVSHSDSQELREIAEDIKDGSIEDPDDEMLGILLHELFPHTINAEEVLSYLHKPKDNHLIGRYHMFWALDICEAANKIDIPILLDALKAMKPSLLDDHTDLGLRKMVGKLLCRAVIEQGEGTTDQRLYEWLGTALDKYDHSHIEREESDLIKEWLEAHSERYKGLLSVGVAICSNNENFRFCISQIANRLFGAKPPEDLGLSWLSLAEAEQDQKKADCLFLTAIGHFFDNQTTAGLSVEFFERWAEERPRFGPVYRRSIYQEIPDWKLEHAESNRKHKEERQKQQDERMQYFRKHLPHIRSGDAPPVVLHDLASAYLGLRIEADGKTGLERLNSFLCNDEELIAVALEGLRRSIERPDLPSVDAILELDVKGRMHYIRQACIAGLEERYNVDPSHVLELSDDILEKAIAFHYTYSNNQVDWFEACVRNRSDIVAKVLIKYVLMQLKAKKEPIVGVYALANNEEYACVALHAVVPLLRLFPSRAKNKQVSNVLNDLLKAALKYMSDEELKRIINEKLVVPKMSVTQRIYWLTAGLVIYSCQYEDALRRFVGKSPARIQSLASFFSDRSDQRGIILDAMQESSLSYLIQMLAPICSPERPRGAHWVSAVMQTAEFVHALVNRLGSTPTEAAANEIKDLLCNTSLSSWHSSFRYALHSHHISLREATYRHPTVREVCDTLDNCRPANAADLAALTMEHLQELAQEIRHGNTDQYKQFWNVDQYARPTKPRPEEACRDTLLDKLKTRLRRHGAEAMPEGHYADDKRADIRVSYTTPNLTMAIPIEIKRDSHRDIWNAISDQLIDLYTREPESKGRGIFLAFWFGGKNIPAHQNGDKPTNAAQLETLLVDLVPADKRELITVCVIDCSRSEKK